MKKAFLTMSMALGFLACQAFSQATSFVAGSTALSNGTTMMYRLYVPKTYKAEKKYPIVVTMHGIGECGNDNLKQVNINNIVKQWLLDSVQAKYAPFILSPQCPSNLAWASNGSADLADIGTVKILDSLKGVYSLDTTRFFVAGLSWGGMGAWGMMKSYPDKFAAAVPCAGNCGGSATAASIDGATLAKTPFWAFHGGSDQVVNPNGSRFAATAVENAGFPVVRFVSSPNLANPTGISADSLRKAATSGARYLYSEVTGGDHSAGWNEAWNHPMLVPWIFSKAKVNGKIVAWPEQTSVSGNSYTARLAAPNVPLLFVKNRTIRLVGISGQDASRSVFSPDGRCVGNLRIRDNGSLSSTGLPAGFFFVTAKGLSSATQAHRINR